MAEPATTLMGWERLLLPTQVDFFDFFGFKALT